MSFQPEEYEGFEPEDRGEQPSEELLETLRRFEIYTEKYGEGREQAPENWAEARRRIFRDLLSITTQPTAIICRALDAAKGAIGALDNFVRGLARIPGSLARRIDRRLTRADADEDRRLAAARDRLAAPTSAAPQLPAPAEAALLSPAKETTSPTGDRALRQNELALPTEAEVIAKLHEFLERLRAPGRGLEADLFEAPGGFIVRIVEPSDEVRDITLAAAELRRLLPPGFPALPPSAYLLPEAPKDVTDSPKAPIDNAATERDAKSKEKEKPIEAVFRGLPKPIEKALFDAGVTTLAQLRAMSEADLLNIPSIGAKRARTIRAWMGKQ